jgi:glycosyltransferase involved in cell wall biosynthesis
VILNRHHREDIVFLLIGEGRLKPELQARAKREGLNNVVFHGAMPKWELVSVMASADVGLQVLANIKAFYYGTSPNKFFDYLASGLPVLCNYPGWVADMIQKADCGVAVPPEDAVAFAEALEDMAASPETRRAQGSNARGFAEDWFDRQCLAEDFSDVLEGAFERS